MRSTIPTITELDAARIREIGIQSQRSGGVTAAGELLEWVSSEADIVPVNSIAPDVVTLGSSVSYKVAGSSEISRVTVVHPVDMSIDDGRISVLSPVGRALLGRKVGELTKVAVPGGRERQLQVLGVHYQPEAAGVPLP